MPGKLKVKILSGRNLPVMDKSSDTTDAFVEVKLKNTTYKTDVFRKSLNPQWNSEWFIFEVDDLDLQDEPLQIRIMDHDTYSANDAIGKVYLDLNPLLTSIPNAELSQQSATQMISGWLPVYDTMHGIRGEVNIIVKVDLFSDFNKFRQSSCGIQFFFSSGIPYGYVCQSILGFVEELVINDDPEYHWIDKIRTPRASNEARQALFMKLSGELQRRIGLKVYEMGGNAVIAYRQCFDLEGDYGIVVRGIGSAVVLCSQGDSIIENILHVDNSISNQKDVPSSPKKRIRQSSCSKGNVPEERKDSPTQSKVSSPSHTVAINRRLSDSDLSVTHHGGGSYTGSGGSSIGKPGFQSPNAQNILMHGSIDMVEFPFLSMKTFPPGFISSIGSTLSVKAVKLLDRSHNPDEEVETRDSWWNSVRTEMKSHCRTISCNVILGYEECATVCEDVCLLMAFGTAALINPNYRDEGNPALCALANKAGETIHEKKECKDRTKKESESKSLPKLSQEGKESKLEKQESKHFRKGSVNKHLSQTSCKPVPEGKVNKPVSKSAPTSCSLCHFPYSESSLPFDVKTRTCGVCRKGKVPDILFTNIEPPSNFPIVGKGCVVQAKLVRPRRDLKGEMNAREISDALPFIEFEIFRQLFFSMKIKGMNMLFDLRTRISTSDKNIIAVATATAVLCAALPPPDMPRTTVTGSSTDLKQRKSEMQDKLHEIFQANKKIYGLNIAQNQDERNFTSVSGTDTEESEDELPDVDFSFGNKDNFMFELDDQADAEFLKHLVETNSNSINIATTHHIPGIPEISNSKYSQFFCKISKHKFTTNLSRAFLSSAIDKAQQELSFKFRKHAPFAITGLKYTVELPEEDEIQILMQGIVTFLCDPRMHKPLEQKRSIGMDKPSRLEDNAELIFRMEEVEDSPKEPKTSTSTFSSSNKSSFPSIPSNVSMSSNSSMKFHSKKLREISKFILTQRIPETHGVKVTPLDYVVGVKIERYMGNLNFFFIRESTSIKESGGMSGFTASFVSEIIGLARAHVVALGGNALTSFFISECILYHNQHKNQGQSLVNICGDVIQVSSSSAYYLPESEEI